VQKLPQKCGNGCIAQRIGKGDSLGNDELHRNSRDAQFQSKRKDWESKCIQNFLVPNPVDISAVPIPVEAAKLAQAGRERAEAG